MREIVIKIADRMMELDMSNLQFDEMEKLITDIAEIIPADIWHEVDDGFFNVCRDCRGTRTINVRSAYDDSEVEEECPCVAKLEESINEQYESEQHA
mgnify:CR=1 FL=1